MEYIRLTTHRIKSQCLEISYWVNIFKLISQLSEILVNLHFVFAGFKSHFSKDPIFLDRFFTFTFINNQPKQMVIFKSLPILSFHIFWEIIFFRYISGLTFLFDFPLSDLFKPQSRQLSILWFFFYRLNSDWPFLVTLSFNMKIGEDRREMFETLLWSFFFLVLFKYVTYCIFGFLDSSTFIAYTIHIR